MTIEVRNVDVDIKVGDIGVKVNANFKIEDLDHLKLNASQVTPLVEFQSATTSSCTQIQAKERPGKGHMTLKKTHEQWPFWNLRRYNFLS